MQAQAESGSQLMTVGGAINKTYLMFFCLLGAGGFAWFQIITGGGVLLFPFLGFGGIGAFALVLITQYKPHWSPITAPAYAIVEGLLLGSLTVIMEGYLPGIGYRAVGLTLGVLFLMLGLYKWGVIRPTEKFRSVIMGAILTIAVFYLTTFVLQMFGVHVLNLHEMGIVGIVISVVIIGVAALSLILDFDLIEQYSEAGVPKYMEWFAALGLMVTLVWLYVEILRLLALLSSD